MSQSAPDRVDAAVSYSRADQARVEPLIAGLKARGLVVWFDKDIPGGALWEEIIARKYRASGALLFFVSRDSLASQRCSEEVSTARTLGKPIIPILLDPLKLPDDLPDRFVLTLQARNTVEAHGRAASAAEDAIIGALAGFGIAPGAPPPAPAPRVAEPPPRAERRRGGALIAFGGAALAIALVAAAYIVFLRPAATPDGKAPAPAAASPVASAKPAKPGPSPAPAHPSPPPASPTAAAAATGEITLALDKTGYTEGDTPVATLAGLPGNANDWVAIAVAGSPDSEYLAYVTTAGKKSGTLKLKPVMTAGRYEARVFLDPASGDRAVKARATFEVAAFPSPVLTLDRDVYLEGEPVEATVTGLPGNAKDWVALAEEGAEPGDFVSYAYTGGGTEATLRLRPLTKPGRYEARVFFNDETGDRTIRAAAAFEVDPAPPVVLTPDAALYAPGASIEIAYSAMPGNEKDWVALAEDGAPDTGFIDYVYTGGAPDGSVSLTAPATPGRYELRAYFDDTTGDKTVRGRVTIEVGEASPEPTLEPTAEATPEPTAEPTPEPTEEPVEEPAADPLPAPDTPEPAAEPEALDCSLPESVAADPVQCPVDCANPAHAAAFPDACPAPP